MATSTSMRPLQLGSTTVHQIVELDRWVFPPEMLFPDIPAALVDEARRTLASRRSPTPT